MPTHTRKPFNFTLTLGLVLLAVANVAKWILERHTSMPEASRDGLAGLLFGLAIGCTLLGIVEMRRSRPGGKSTC